MVDCIGDFLAFGIVWDWDVFILKTFEVLALVVLVKIYKWIQEQEK